jgi:hypothetical protein
MVICLACGNCTDDNTCEVCGMVMSIDNSHENEEATVRASSKEDETEEHQAI